MEFSIPEVAAAEARVAPPVLELLAREDREGSIMLALAGRPLVRAILPLVLPALASRAGIEAAGLAQVKRLAEDLAGAADAEQWPGHLTLQARLTASGIDLRFSPLGERLERALREGAVSGPGDGALVLAEGEPGEGPEEMLVLRLRSTE
jgi:hypothetical protein